MGDQLDDEQSAAVFATEPTIAVLAGPGSGKTRTLSFRAQHLLAQDETSGALLLTFTNKAAAEMKARAMDVAGVSSKRLFASTFHTFCADVLRSHGDLVGFPREFDILDSEEAKELARQLAFQHSTVASLADDWNRARLRREEAASRARSFGAHYQQAKREAKVVDFDDLVVGVASLFEARPDVVGAYAARFRHVLVDEFQDTNAVQSVIVHSLARQVKTTSVFADDDQAIFGFAGAEAAHIRTFVETLEAKVYPLTTNYRSAENIVATANAIITAATRASGRKMRATRPGGQVERRRFATVEEEAEQLATEIAARVAGGTHPADVAILVRSGWRAGDLIEALMARGVAVSDWRGDSHAPNDRRLLRACLAAVRGTISKSQSAVLCATMGIEAAGEVETETFLAVNAESNLARGLARMRDVVFGGGTPHAVAQAAQEAVAAQNANLGASLAGIVESIARFEEYDKDFTLEHLLAELALGSIGRAPTVGGGVKVASLHRTKGLQWKIVYLLGLEEGHHPDRRAMDTAESIDAERRLFFVGVSRAEDVLVVTSSESSLGYPRQRSRFLDEMGL